MLDFIKRHWVVYLIAAVMAVVIGFGCAYVVGEIGSTPADAHAATEEASAEEAVSASAVALP